MVKGRSERAKRTQFARARGGAGKSEARSSKSETGEAQDHSGELKKQTQSRACGGKHETRNPKLVPIEAEGSETGEAQDDAGELKKRTQFERPAVPVTRVAKNKTPQAG